MHQLVVTSWASFLSPEFYFPIARRTSSLAIQRRLPRLVIAYHWAFRSFRRRSIPAFRPLDANQLRLQQTASSGHIFAPDFLCIRLMMTIFSRSFDSLRTNAGSVAWRPIVIFSRGAVLGLLRGIEVGQVVVSESNGEVTVCGNPGGGDNDLRADLKVSMETFWVRALLFADMVRALGLTLEIRRLLDRSLIERLREMSV